MREISKPVKIVFGVFLAITIILAVASMYKESKNKLLDKKEFAEIVKNIETDSENLKSNEEMKDQIVAWADREKLDYTLDDAGNIIFEKDASSDKTDVNPVVIAISYNYLTAENSAPAIATAECIANSKLDSGKYTVIFFNNEDDYGKGYLNISDRYFTDDTKVVYLDFGDKAYMSKSSFASAMNTITIPSAQEPVTCDTAIKLKIGGITSGDPGNNLSKQPNPITALGTVLSRLNNKSITYQLSDIKVISHGNMYATGIEATIFINSYSLQNFTSYLDERSEKFIKAYKEDFPNVEYSYEVLEDKSAAPTYAYSKESAASLNSILYTVKNGTYRFTDKNAPNGMKENDIYGTNVIEDLTYSDNNLVLSLGTSAMSKSYLEEILGENKTAAGFANATADSSNYTPVFNNEDSQLADELRFAYVKVNMIGSKNMIIKEDVDKIFTPCSYLRGINDNMDIVHLREDEDCAAIYANTLLCFIKDQGNFLSL